MVHPAERVTAQTASQYIHLALRTSTGAAENAELAGLYAAGTISAATRQRLQHALDLELARLGNETD